jgi:Response regulator containing a CheY-like receiver domain and an HTH DNA-binding domain
MITGKILIVDDDNVAASVMQLYLSSMGHDIIQIANNGKDAVELARDFHPDLVLMDIYLGKGLNGIDAAEIISKHYHIPVIFVTSYADTATLEKAKCIEHFGYINKPLRETDLKTTIEFALSRCKPLTRRPPAGKSTLHDILRSLYSLTRTEAKVVEKFLEYPDISFVADSLKISLSTARTHLKRIFLKTNTNRQSVLVHKIITGPAGALTAKDEVHRQNIT